MENQKEVNSPICKGMLTCGKSFATVNLASIIIPLESKLDHKPTTCDSNSVPEESFNCIILPRVLKIKQNRVIDNKNNEIEAVKDEKNDSPIASTRRNLANFFDDYESEDVKPLKDKIGSLKLDNPDTKEKINEAARIPEVNMRSKKRKVNQVEFVEKEESNVTNVGQKEEKVDRIQAKKRKIIKTKVDNSSARQKQEIVDNIQVKKRKVTKTEAVIEKPDVKDVMMIQVKEIEGKVVKEESNVVNEVASAFGKVKKTRSTKSVKLERDPYNLRPRVKKVL